MKGRKFSKTGLILVGCMLVCVVLFIAIGAPGGFFGDGGKGDYLDDENTPGIGQVLEGDTPLLVFDKSDGARSLMKAFDEGRIAGATVTQLGAGADGSDVSGSGGNDAAGSGPDGAGAAGSESDGSEAVYEATDQEGITQIYKALKNIVVKAEAGSGNKAGADDMAGTDAAAGVDDPADPDSTAGSDSAADSGGEVWFEFEDGSGYGYSFDGKGVLRYEGTAYEISGDEALWVLLEEKQNGLAEEK